MKRFSFAFTLAEILITLTILGVIAVISISSIQRFYQKKIVETKFTEFYSIMTAVIDQSVIENGPMDTWENDESTNDASYNIAKKYILPYLSISEISTIDNPIEKLQYPVKKASNDDIVSHSVNNGSTAKYCLKNGICFAFYFDLWLDDNKLVSQTDGPTENRIGQVGFDINGAKAPNRTGKDNFLFDIFKDTNSASFYLDGNEYSKLHLDDENYGNSLYDECKNDSSEWGGYLCTFKIIHNHFKIPKDYPWL